MTRTARNYVPTSYDHGASSTVISCYTPLAGFKTERYFQSSSAKIYTGLFNPLLVVLVLAIGTTRPAIALGERPNVSPFDGGVTVPRPLSAILPALPLDLGTDLSLFGVSSADLATAGPAMTTDPDPNFVVDDNGLDCPTATYTSIQAAVTVPVCVLNPIR